MNSELSSGKFQEKVVDLGSEPEKDKSPGSTTADSQDDYRNLCEKLLAGVYVIQGGRFSYANSRLSDILGYESSAELIGKLFWEFVHPDDRRLVKVGREGEEIQVFPGEYILRLFKKDGTIIWVRMEGSILNYQGKPATVGYLIDALQFKEKEKALRDELEKYQTFLNEIEDAIGEVDLKGNVRLFNNASLRIWGASYEESFGRNYRTYMDPETAKIVSRAYNQVYSRGNDENGTKRTFYESIIFEFRNLIPVNSSSS